jgi:hypothetical protein
LRLHMQRLSRGTALKYGGRASRSDTLVRAYDQSVHAVTPPTYSLPPRPRPGPLNLRRQAQKLPTPQHRRRQTATSNWPRRLCFCASKPWPGPWTCIVAVCRWSCPTTRPGRCQFTHLLALSSPSPPFHLDTAQVCSACNSPEISKTTSFWLQPTYRVSHTICIHLALCSHPLAAPSCFRRRHGLVLGECIPSQP